MAKRILLIDKDEAFGTMMAEAMAEAGDYQVQLVGTAALGLTTLRQTPADLVILDLGVDDVPPPHVVRGLRMLRPNIPVLVIPLDGGEVPPELNGLGVQGALHKIFFRFDLGARLEAAVAGRSVTAASPFGGGPILGGPPLPPASPARSESQPSAPAATRGTPQASATPTSVPPGRSAPFPVPAKSPQGEPRPAPGAGPPPAAPGAERAPERPKIPELKLGTRASSEIEYQLRQLANETSADAVLFTYGGQLIASSGLLPRARVAELAVALDETWHAMNRLGVLLGDAEGLGQALFEGKEHIVYSVRVGTYGAISVATSAGTSPGALRLPARKAAGVIEQLVV